MNALINDARNPISHFTKSKFDFPSFGDALMMPIVAPDDITSSSSDFESEDYLSVQRKSIVKFIRFVLNAIPINVENRVEIIELILKMPFFKLYQEMDDFIHNAPSYIIIYI